MDHIHEIGPESLKAALHDGKEIALIDVREAGQFGERHLFYAKSLPYSRLELEMACLVPRLTTRVVIVADDDALAHRAAAAIESCGYTNVAILAGGLDAWEQAGFALFAGVNVVSKTFGELVEHHLGTPSISARQLHDMQSRGERVIVLDGRPFEEYQQMAIPQAVCCPNGELNLRIDALAPDEDTVVVINCAGRTRSIIGAQTLIELGIPHPVYALENGTQGWRLEGLSLEYQASRRYPDDEALETEELAQARLRADGFARRANVREIDVKTLAAWLADPLRTTYVFDIRTPEEFELDHISGTRHAPGGQLIQATDQYIGVQNARVVLTDHDGIRAPVIAAWLSRMGIEVVLLDASRVEGSIGAISSVPSAVPQALQEVSVEEAWKGIREGVLQVVDVRASMHYRAAHIPSARWAIRPRIVDQLAGTSATLLFIADDPSVAALAAHELPTSQREHARLLAGGMAAWRRADLPIEESPDTPPDHDCIDYLFFVHDRHQGNLEASRQYLAWETNLVRQLDNAELASYRLTSERSEHAT